MIGSQSKRSLTRIMLISLIVFMDMFLYESVSCVCLCLSDEPVLVLYICMNNCCIVLMFGWPQGR